jgi:hypothetical protein
MASNEKTSPEVAEIASKGLKDPAGLTNAEIRKLAASALTQVADAPKKKVATKAKAEVKVKVKVKKKPAVKSAKKKPVKKK